jgi:hypothetical protein
MAPPNPRMQPTGRRGASMQLVRISLGRRTTFLERTSVRWFVQILAKPCQTV